jgi:hypothetical protein
LPPSLIRQVGEEKGGFLPLTEFHLGLWFQEAQEEMMIIEI